MTISRRGVLTASALVLAGCSVRASDPGVAADHPGASGPSGTATAQSINGEPEPTWGPTLAELDQASALMADWSEEELVGQLIVGRYHTQQPSVAGDLVDKLHLAGVCTTPDNLSTASQVRATTAAVAAALVADNRTFPPVIGVDQEGGSTEHLRRIATAFPAFATAGSAIKRHPQEGAAVVTEAAAATGEELRTFGYTWVFAPVADVTIGARDPIIGSRSASKDPEIAAAAVQAAVQGFNAGGIISTLKHFPGHGSATTDSHKAMPTISASLSQLESHDLVPFVAGISAGAPAGMMGHLDVTAIAPGGPASLQGEAYSYLRETLGFQGVTITDSLGMGAVMGGEDPGVRALQAGADLILMPADTVKTHAAVLAALRAGKLNQDRLSQSATRVVALQLCQRRRALASPADRDTARRRARKAAAALVAAG